MIPHNKWSTVILAIISLWLVIGIDTQRSQQQEDPNRLFLQARPPRVDRTRYGGYRGQLTVPQAFAGLKVSPSVYRWMIGLYGGTATSRMGVTVAESADPSLDRRVNCCSGYVGETRDGRNCTRMGGECCAREFTDYPGAGGMGLIHPKKLKKSRQAYQGNCYHCYEVSTVCLIGN